MRRIILAALAALLLNGCTIAGYMSMDEIVGNGKVVRAEDSYTMFLFFGYDGDSQVHRVKQQLQKKCGGKVTGVTTMVDVTWYVLVTTTTMKAEANCAKR